MEGQLASLAPLSSPQKPVFFRPEPFDFDAEAKKVFDMCKKYESMKRYPFNTPESHDYFPGADCYRLIDKNQSKLQMAKFSGQALAYFNKTHNTDYEFEAYVELTLSGISHSFAIHCNFTAKPQSAPFKPSDFSPKLFFAELHPGSRGKLALSVCSIIDDAETHNKKGCLMCPEGVMSHPISFKNGYKPPLSLE